MRYLLDTSALLAHFRKESGGAAVQALFEDAKAEVMVSSITVAEFSRRMRDLGADEESLQEALEFYLSLMDEVVAVTVSIAKASDGLPCATPARLPLADALIAACAAARDATLVHRDAHMRLIPAARVKHHDLEDSPVS